MKEISKKKWSRFCGDITNAYLFARVEVIRIDPDGIETIVNNGAPLLSLLLMRKRGKISAFEVKLGQIRNGSPTSSLIMLGAPVNFLHASLTDKNMEVIEVHNKDGHKVIIRIFSHSIEESYKSFVNEMAYSLAKTRGFVPGHEQKDWFLAEKLIGKLVA